MEELEVPTKRYSESGEKVTDRISELSAAKNSRTYGREVMRGMKRGRGKSRVRKEEQGEERGLAESGKGDRIGLKRKRYQEAEEGGSGRRWKRHERKGTKEPLKASMRKTT